MHLYKEEVSIRELSGKKNANKTGKGMKNCKVVCIWGQHIAYMYPTDKSKKEMINSEWIEKMKHTEHLSYLWKSIKLHVW